MRSLFMSRLEGLKARKISISEKFQNPSFSDPGWNHFCKKNKFEQYPSFRYFRCFKEVSPPNMDKHDLRLAFSLDSCL
jgi:hypothetical protein